MTTPEDSLADSIATSDSAEDYEECSRCKHYPAYHDGDGGRPCRAWNPDNNDHKCVCVGWKKKPIATTVVVIQRTE